MKYAVEMGLGAVIYVLSVIQIGSAIQKLIQGRSTDTHTQQGNLISLFLFYFFKIRKVGYNKTKKRIYSVKGNES
jgi:hypothetical protein